MILLPRRTFLALCAVIVGTTAFLLLAIAAQHGFGPLARFARRNAAWQFAAARCPALAGQGFRDDQEIAEAYNAISIALSRGSLARVPENAARLAEAFQDINPAIAASARRLVVLHDPAAARREFQRLTALFSRRPYDGDEDEADEDEAPAARALEV